MATLVQPDTQFIREVMAAGGADLKKCYQCATCSTVCQLAPEDAPFPRKQMLAAQWGMTERLAADPAVWLCHNCGDCTRQCPRGARPGDVLGALRAAAIRRFAFPGWLGALVASPKGLPLLLLLPVLIFSAMAWTAPQNQPGKFAHLFPIPTLEALFFTVAGLVVLAFAIGAARFVRALRAAGAGGSIGAGLVPALVEIATHERLAQCGQEKNRRLGHLLTLWGFVGLAAVGTIVGLGHMAGLVHTPLPPFYPLKIFANLGAVVMLIGCAVLLADRAKRAGSTYFDWLFLWTLLGVVATGVASELLRWAGTNVMYGVYFVHLVLVFALFLYAPYSKFAHLLYRTLAMAATRRTTIEG
jgi:quinone-modifying oxidoreductase subunit QmoC